MEISKQVPFSGVEKFFPHEMQEGIQELVRRLENFENSMLMQLRAEPTIFVGDETPEGMKAKDVWLLSSGNYLIYDGTNWS